MDRDERYWFPAKRFGWGWGLPQTWQGWGVFLAYLAGMAAAAGGLLPLHPLGFAAAIALLTALFVWACYAKGEPPAWRWGGRE